jgi:signal transduction histidine kinase
MKFHLQGLHGRRGRLDLAGQSLEFLLDGGADAVPETRKVLLAADGFVPDSVRDDLLLLASELVSNAVRHGGVEPGQAVRVALRLREGLVRLEVTDPGGQFTRARVRERRDETGGWGLFLVDRIATRWGVRRTSTGTAVWFELAENASR